MLPANSPMRAEDSEARSRRPTRLIVDRGAIRANAAVICQQLSPATQLMAVVKANGYGHGAVVAAQAAIDGGATWLGVATVTEAVELRDAGIEAPVLVLGPSGAGESSSACVFAISIGVGDLGQFETIVDRLSTKPPVRPLGVHLKIDTGMRRFGVTPVQAPGLAARIAESPYMVLEGIYSHFAEADAPGTDIMDRQFELFRETVQRIDDLGIDRGIAHISNSAALLRNRSSDLDMVRAGICLYGITPSDHVGLFEGMRPALQWRATVQHITELEPGDRVGYGGTYVATERERIALLPFGYADGYPRLLSNRGWAGFRGHQLPVRGRVSMDQCAVGIDAAPEIAMGDEVTVLGDPESGAPTANQLGELVDTIGYEIVSRISRRVPVDYR